jgi:hypothetical protein
MADQSWCALADLVCGTVTPGGYVQPGVDDAEREALRAEGLDPDNAAHVAAVDLVRWELSPARYT